MTPDELRRARRLLGVTQGGLCALMGLRNLRKLQRWEGGETKISDEGATLVKLLLKQREGEQHDNEQS